MKKALLTLILCSAAAAAQTAEQGVDASLGITTLPLWPSGAAAIAGTPADESPTLTVFVPQAGKGTGSAVVVAPGGAYLIRASNLEGRQVADWFASQGVYLQHL